MTDIALAASPTSTPLSAWLASGDSRTPLAAYHGAITPVRLDALSTETAALISGAGLHDLGWLRRIQVRGADRFRWLSGMVTNMVKDLPGNGGAWNLVLNSQGRIQGDLTVWRNAARNRTASSATPDAVESGSDDTLELEIAADQLDRLLSHLDHFIIMDDVELTPRENESAIGLTGPQAGRVLSRLGLPSLSEPLTHVRADFNGMSLRIRRGYGVLAQHYELWTSLAAQPKLWKFLMTGGAVPVGSTALEAFRIAEGIPSYGVDMQERDLPQETSQLRALHFSKGCYLGQEIVERIRSRGNVHRHLRQLELDGPLPAQGTEIMQDGTAAGHITSAAELPLAAGPRRFALAMVRAEAETRDLPITYTAGESSGTGRLLPGPATL